VIATSRFFLKPVPLSEFSTWMLALLCVQYWAGIAVMLAGTPSLEGIVAALTQVSVLPVVEWYVLFGLARTFKSQDVSAPLALGSLALLALASVAFPHQRLAFLVETVFLFIAWNRTPQLKRIGLILLIIALQRGLGMEPLHGVVSRFDAQAVEGLMAAIGHPITRVGNLLLGPNMPDGLLVLAHCASTILMFPMGFGFIALVLTDRERLTRTDWQWLAAILAAAIVINLVRLSLMLRGQEAYESLHEGTGASVIGLLGMVVTLAAWLAATGKQKSKAS
jgi:hypothetical protein